MQLVETADMAQQGVDDVAFQSFVGRFGPFLSCVAGFFWPPLFWTLIKLLSFSSNFIRFTIVDKSFGSEQILSMVSFVPESTGFIISNQYGYFVGARPEPCFYLSLSFLHYCFILLYFTWRYLYFTFSRWAVILISSFS